MQILRMLCVPRAIRRICIVSDANSRVYVTHGETLCYLHHHQSRFPSLADITRRHKSFHVSLSFARIVTWLKSRLLSIMFILAFSTLDFRSCATRNDHRLFSIRCLEVQHLETITDKCLTQIPSSRGQLNARLQTQLTWPKSTAIASQSANR
jgi:hypothetical protein